MRAREETITAVCAAHGAAWVRRAERALNGVRRHSPGVECVLDEYRKGHRFAALGRVETEWALYMDADVLVLDDVRPVLDRADGANMIIRLSPLPCLPAWRPARWRALMRDYQMTPRPPLWNGVFFARRDLAHRIAARVRLWKRRYLQVRPPVLVQPHKKPDQCAITLACAEAGARARLVGPEFVSWHGHPEPRGRIHHFSGVVYRRLEQKGRFDEYDRTA